MTYVTGRKVLVNVYRDDIIIFSHGGNSLIFV